MTTVVVFGATGYTGRLIVRALLEMGVKNLVLGGRDAKRLRQMAGEHGGLEWRLADVDRSYTLGTLLHGAHVVIDAVGPFLRFGEPVVRAAIEHRVHFLDITAEQSYMSRILAGYDAAAKAKGVVVVNAQGLEFAAGMCAAALLAESDPSIDTIDVFTRVDNHAWSRGSSKSSLGAIFQDQLELRDGRVAARRTSFRPRRVTMPDRDRPEHAIPFPGAEALHLRRAYPQLRNATGNLIMPAAQAYAATAIVGLRPVLRLLVRPALLDMVRRRIDTGPEGPSAEARRTQTFHIMARGLTASGGVASIAVAGEDAYGMTGVIAAVGARMLIEHGPRAVGVVSTPEAFGAAAFLQALEPWGVTTSGPHAVSASAADAR